MIALDERNILTSLKSGSMMCVESSGYGEKRGFAKSLRKRACETLEVLDLLGMQLLI